MLRRLVGTLGLLLAALLALVLVLGRDGCSARARPSAVEAFVARRLRRLATPAAVAARRNPVAPTPLHLAEGRDHFADHCAVCHANDGSGRTTINDGLYPPAPDLREPPTQDLTDGELAAIIENGIRFTGMPGWGTDEPEETWKLVRFIRHLPQLTPAERDFMKEINELD